MMRDWSVEHVDTDDAVADHEEDGPDKHDPASRHPGLPDGCCEPEDVDWDTNREERINQTSLEQRGKYFKATQLNLDLQEIKIDGSAGSIQDQCQTETEDEAVPEHFVCPDTPDIEIMAHREIEHPQQESFLPNKSSVTKR